jgi:transposase
MMGSRDPQKQLWNYQVNLDKRVRSDHPLRRIDEVLKLDFVRGEVARFYGRKGNVSEDPVVIVKMMILLFLDDVRSERELMRIIAERLDYMWFLGYGLDDVIPNHSVLSKARKRWGQELFDTLFYRVVTQCVEAGLVDGSKIHVDSSLIEANASTNSVRTLDAAMREKIQQACREQTGKLDERSTQDQAEDRDDDNDERPADKTSVEINQRLRSSTDPEATLCRQSGLKSRPRYKNHRVLDDAHEIITAVKTTTGVVNEAHELMGLIEEHNANTARFAETIVADCKYGTTQNYIACQERKLRTHMADLLKHQDNKGRREGIYPDSAFQYQPQSNTYLCPANEVKAVSLESSRADSKAKSVRHSNPCPSSNLEVASSKIVVISLFGSTGLPRCARKPARGDRARSSLLAAAVKAIAGVCPSRGSRRWTFSRSS